MEHHVGRARNDLPLLLDARDIHVADPVGVEFAQPLALQVGVGDLELPLGQQRLLAGLARHPICFRLLDRPSQQLGQERNQQGHAHDAERIRDAIADRDRGGHLRIHPADCVDRAGQRGSVGHRAGEHACSQCVRVAHQPGEQHGHQPRGQQSGQGHDDKLAALPLEGAEEARAGLQPDRVDEEQQAQVHHRLGNGQPEVAEGQADEEDRSSSQRHPAPGQAAEPRANGKDREEDEHLLGEECAHIYLYVGC